MRLFRCKGMALARRTGGCGVGRPRRRPIRASRAEGGSGCWSPALALPGIASESRAGRRRKVTPLVDQGERHYVVTYFAVLTTSRTGSNRT